MKREIWLQHSLSPILQVVIPMFEILPFFFQPDNVIGKVVLLCKFAIVSILYGLYFSKIRWIEHITLWLAEISMFVTALTRGSYGVVVIISIMLMAMISFPKLYMRSEEKGKLFFRLGCADVLVIFYGLCSNIKIGIPFFSFEGGVFNANTYGLLFLSIFCYFVCFIYLCVGQRLKLVKLVILYCSTLLGVYCTGCRSALISLGYFMVVLAFCSKKPRSILLYYCTVAISLFLAVGISFLSDGLKQAYSDILTKSFLGKNLFTGREIIWKYAITGYLLEPIFGVGDRYFQLLGSFSTAHNVFLGIMIVVGTLPALAYCKLLFSPKQLFGYNKSKKQLFNYDIVNVCFMTSMITAIFECVYTDARLNFLFLPLLLGSIDKNSESTARIV